MAEFQIIIFYYATPTKLTLSVHHANFTPEDNQPENLIALCTLCHLALHGRTKRSNVSPGQNCHYGEQMWVLSRSSLPTLNYAFDSVI